MHCIGKSFKTWNFVLLIKELKRIQKHTIKYAQNFWANIKFPNCPVLITFSCSCNDFADTKYDVKWGILSLRILNALWTYKYGADNSLITIIYEAWRLFSEEGLHTLIKISIVFPCPISRSLLVSHNIELWVFVDGIWWPHCLIIIKMVH